MTAPVAGVLLALASATLHAAWNVRLKASGDPLQLAARALPVATAAATPAVFVAWLLLGRPPLPVEGIGLALISGGLELGYFGLLSAAYRRGAISSVYPVARGTAPLIAIVVGIGVLGESLTGLQLAGAAAIVLGVWLSRPTGTSRAALLPAIGTGLFIAAYSTADRIGVRTGPFWLYGWAVFVATSAFLLPWWGKGPVRGVPAVGALTISAYSLVLLAFSIAPLALVAPAREAGVVLVAGWGIARLGERERPVAKLMGATSVLVGAALLVI
ncbi:MAG: DMT family transporter [Chloroflexota bacterium]|nr:DMT family transporter [Chloroflexota bacterium]